MMGTSKLRLMHHMQAVQAGNRRWFLPFPNSMLRALRHQLKS